MAAPPSLLPEREIPGDYGLPVVGAIRDRLDYFYNQGQDAFFSTRQAKHNSTVFRTNMVPGPFMARDPRVIVLLDGASFPVLFDMEKVEKRDVFTGTFMPPTSLTGGYRILSYLDPSETNHTKLKQLLFNLLSKRKDQFIPAFHSSFSSLFTTMETQLASKGKSDFNALNEVSAFEFLCQSFYGVSPTETKLGSDGPKCMKLWLLFNLHPLISTALPKYLDDLLFHVFHFPSFIVKPYYNKLYNFIKEAGKDILDHAEKMEINREEACHNLLFATCFNSYGGMKVFFPSLLKWIGLAGEELHSRLAQEIRNAIKDNGGKVTMAALEQMPLMKSVVYETLRIDPPVQFQYGKAKKDLVITSHDASFKVKKGEMLFGYQPFATKDAKIFDKAESFVGDRFVGDSESLLRHVLWSNGPETESPTVQNKQCAGKNFVVLIGRLLVVELFLRYNTFTVEVSKDPVGVGPLMNVTSLTKANGA